LFLTAFAFLNMVIGIVVNVLEEQHQKEVEEDPDQVSLTDLYREIQLLKATIELQSVATNKDASFRH
jgi:voltage-gated sodium channel